MRVSLRLPRVELSASVFATSGVGPDDDADAILLDDVCSMSFRSTWANMATERNVVLQYDVVCCSGRRTMMSLS